MDTHFGFGHE